MKSNAAAIQSSGRRGILVSVLIELQVLLVCSVNGIRFRRSEQTRSAQTAVKMHLSNGGRNFSERGRRRP